jgi:predicted DNA-binding transcriptional regulator AlpA
VCGRNKQLYGGERGCQSVGGRRLENRVLDEVFAILEPASLAATAKALAEADANHRRHVTVFELAVERARFEADRARRQFDAVEPENRLVARTLERSLEAALVAQRAAEANLGAQRLRQPTRLTDEETAWLARAGADVRAVFHASTTTWRERKQLLRAVIAEVVVTVAAPARRAEVNIVWEGGATTGFALDLNKTGKHFRTTDEDTVDLVRRLAERYDDKTIAAVLAKQGRRTGTGLAFTKTRVKTLRVSRGIPAHQPPDPVTPASDDGLVVSITAAEKLLGVSRVTLYRWLNDGFIHGEQLTPGSPWHIRITDDLRRRIVGDAPDGWLNLDQAAKTLGVARQTVLHKVQRGDLEAVHVNRGRRKGLRINVNGKNPGLFDTPR